ncbi:hypothetical protein MRX96_030691 [Rhipicephalus microplus]
MTTPSAAATTRSQSPRAAQHKATPRPAPVPAPQPATTVQRAAAMGLNTGSPLLIGNPATAQPGMFPAGPAHDTFLLNQYIPGLDHSPILIQGALGQTQSSLEQIRGVQLALRPPHATGLTLGPQTGLRPHGGHPGPPGTPTLVIPQNLGPRPNIFLAPPRMMSPPLVCHSPGTDTDAPTAAGHAAHADHAGPAHTGLLLECRGAGGETKETKSEHALNLLFGNSEVTLARRQARKKNRTAFCDNALYEAEGD